MLHAVHLVLLRKATQSMPYGGYTHACVYPFYTYLCSIAA